MDDNICRVCRSGSDSGPLYHPCKCSGSMRYIHQSCLEEWLKVSGKTQCDICHYKYHFQPVYSENAPARLSVFDAFRIIMKRLASKILWQYRVLLAIFAWLIWVPFVTSWTWRLYLNPTGMFEQQPAEVGERKPILTNALREYTLSTYPWFLDLLEALEVMADWKLLIKRFCSDVFEGQIIAAVVIILGMCLLLLREYVLHFVQEQEANERRQRRNRRPAPMGFAPHARRNPFNPNADARREELLRRRLEELRREQRARAPPQQPPTLGQQQEANLLNRQLNEQRTKDLLALEASLRRHSVSSDDDLSHEKNSQELVDRKQKGPMPVEQSLSEQDKFNFSDSTSENQPNHQNEKRRRISYDSEGPSIPASGNEGKLTLDTTVPAAPQKSEELSPVVEILKYNLRSRRSSQDLDVKEWFGPSIGIAKSREKLHERPFMKPHERPVMERQPSADTLSDTEMKAQIETDIRELDTASEGSVGVNHSEGSPIRPLRPNSARSISGDSDPDTSLHEVARLIRNRVEREQRVAPPQPVPVDEVPIQLNPNEENILNDEQNPEDAEEAVRPQVNINVGIGDGEIVAQIELNDLQGFLDLVGVNGPILMLLQNIALVHLLVFVVLGVGVWIPYMLGSVTNYFVTHVLYNAMDVSIKRSLDLIQKVTDPVIEPVVDLILIAMNITPSNYTVTENANNGTAVPYLDGLYKLFGITQAKNGTVGVKYGPYHPNFFQSFQEDLSSVMLGYCTILLLFLLYMNTVVSNSNHYMAGISRAVNAIQSKVVMGVRILVFIVLELAMFPFFCGLLIDWCTLTLFSTTVANRIALYEYVPILFICGHWVIGSAFMFNFASYVGMVREIIRPGVLWFIKDPNDPNFNAFREIYSKSIFVQLKKLFLGSLLYGIAIAGTLYAPIYLLKLYDQLIERIHPSPTIFHVFPLRLEYHDTTSELPFDLFFFQFALPQLYALLNPNAKFRLFVRKWFEKVSQYLRLSDFLMGKYALEEESDIEEDMIPARAARRNRIPSSQAAEHEAADSEWEDEAGDTFPVAQHGKPKANKRLFRYLRVPNHDGVEVIPGQKMLVWMKDMEPVFGRPNETPEQVERNWTKVYAPNHFYKRVLAVLILHLLSFSLGISLMLGLPILVGRAFFTVLNRLTWVHVLVPSSYVNPILPKRSELPTHDFYSYFAGICICTLMACIVSIGLRLLKRKPALVRRNSIRRPPNVVLEDEDQNWIDADEPFTLRERFQAFYQRNIQLRLVKCLKLGYIILFGGVICPILIGLTIDFYFLSPFNMILNRKQIVFLFLDWSSGAMLMRILYNICRLFPDQRIGQMIQQAHNGGLFNLDIFELHRVVFSPMVKYLSMALLVPLFARMMEINFDFEYGTLMDYTYQYLPLLFFASVVGLTAAVRFWSSTSEWFERLKDDQYLVGQALQNVDE